MESLSKSLTRFVAAGLCWLTLMAVTSFASEVWEVTGWEKHYHPALQIKRTNDPIKIDGILDETGWRDATRATNFTEHSPGQEVAPVVRTEAMMTYDDKNVYFAAICYCDPTQIRATLAERERIFSDDNIGFFFDTYGDGTSAYVLNVNPFGIQYDARWSSNYGEDGAFDMIWESNGIITDSGYQVEVAIPFSSLRFPNKPVQEWRVDFYRHHIRESHYSMSWATYDEAEQCWPCKWGTVTGMENVSPGRGIELMPTFVSYQYSNVTDLNRPDSTFQNSDLHGRPSLNAKYGITSNMLLEAAVNPDFSQVEADAAQIDVNSTFALYYDERRPFFQEGIDLFRTNFNMIYTRTINDPKFATKFSGRFGKTGIAYLAAYDEHSPIIVPFEEDSWSLSVGRSVTNMFAARHSFSGSSHISFVATDRRFDGGGSGTLASLDGAIRLSKSDQFIWQAMGTHTEELPGVYDTTSGYFDGGRYTRAMDGESFYGHAFLAGVRHNSSHLYTWMRYYERDPTYRASNGYQPQNNDRRVLTDIQYQIPIAKGVISSVNPYVGFGRLWNFDGLRKDEFVSLSLGANWRVARTYTEFNTIPVSNERFHGTDFRGIWTVSGYLQTSPVKWATLGGNLSHGKVIARNVGRFGRDWSGSFWMELHPNDRLLIEPQFTTATSISLDHAHRWYQSSIVRTRINFQASKRLSVRLVLQYVDSWGLGWINYEAPLEGGFYEKFKSREFSVDPLITFRINPFSVFYLGSTYAYSDVFDYGNLHLPQDNVNLGNFLTDRQFFMKIQYLFQV